MAQTFFLPAPDGHGQRLCVHHAPAGPVTGAVLYLHPLAEEMNKSRRMAALTARALAGRGLACLQIDLKGCGDSSAEFGEAGWDDWLADAALALDWLRQRHPGAPLWLWGLRAGALLACDLARRDVEAAGPDPLNLLLWQPPTQGALLLQQFLRLRLAAELAAEPSGHAGKGLMNEMKQRLAAGECVEVAGYELSPALAHGLGAARLSPPPARLDRVIWLELAGAQSDAQGDAPDEALLPATQMALQAWQAQGLAVQARALNGPAFWQTTEIELAPALLEATLQTLTAGRAAEAWA